MNKNKNKRTKVFIRQIILFSFVLILSCKGMPDKAMTAASFELGDISLNELENAMLEERFSGSIEKASSSRMEQRREFLSDRIYRQIIFDLVEKEKLDTLENIKEEVQKKIYSNAIVRGLIPDSVMKKVISEQLVKDRYENKKVKYLVDEIFISGLSNESRQIADSIYTEVSSGIPFSDISKGVSDKNIKYKKAEEYKFIYELDKMAKNRLENLSKNGISQPERSVKGYHIYIIADQKENTDISSYEKERSGIMKELTRKNASSLNTVFFDLTDSLMIRYNVVIDSSSMKTFIKIFEKYRSSDKKERNEIEKDINDHKITIAEFGERKIDAGSIIKKLKMFPEEKWPLLKSYKDVKFYVVSEFKNLLLEKYADELGYTEKEEYVTDAKRSMYGKYNQEIIDIYVRSRIEKTPLEDLKKYYEDNLEKFSDQNGGYKEFKKVKVSIENYFKSRKFKNQYNEWKRNIFKKYNVVIYHKVIEKSFYYVEDNKK